MKPGSVSPRGAVEIVSAAPRVRSIRAFTRTKFFKVLTALAALCGVVAIARWAGKDESVPKEEGGAPASPIQIKQLKSLIVRKEGKKYWEIAASQVSLSPGSNMTVANNVSKGILYRDGKPLLSMRSPSVRFSNRTNNLAAIGGVQVKGPNGFTFSTPQALWINRTKTIECPQPVKVTLRGMKVSAPQLFYNWNSGVLQCPQPVEVQAKGATLRAKRFEANLHTRVLELKGGAEFHFSPQEANPDQLRGLLPE